MSNQVSLPLALAIVVLMAASATAWAAVIHKWLRGEPIVAYAPRRDVPWTLGELAFVVAVYLVLQVAASALIFRDRPTRDEATKSARAGGAEQRNDHRAASDPLVPDEHPIVRLLRSHPSPWTIVLCGLAAVVIAPIAEEFFFRLLLQGWLEAEQGRLSAIPALSRYVPGAFPVVTSALLFALVHLRVGPSELDAEVAIRLLIATSVVYIVTLAAGATVLVLGKHATRDDLGIDLSQIVGDIRLGLAAFAFVAVPVYAVQVTLTWLLPPWIAADPAPLFLLAIVLGYLYQQTHRLLPSIVLHFALNACSLGLFWLVPAGPNAAAHL